MTCPPLRCDDDPDHHFVPSRRVHEQEDCAGVGLGLATTGFAQEAGAFKVYGFTDINFYKDVYESNNFLSTRGNVQPNQQLYLNHLNTYFDWKPNDKVRMLAEVSYNRDPFQKQFAGLRIHPDSAAIYGSLYSQAGAATSQLALQKLKSLGLGSALSEAVLQHMADSIAADTLGKSTSSIIANIKAGSLRSQPSSSSKDNGISLPRVHADLLFSDLVNLRVGKWITPAGIWNVDHGSPTILTINQPNQTSFIPIFPESQTGLQLFGRSSAGDHDLYYNAWVSTGRNVDIQGLGDYAQAPKTLADWSVGTHLQADLALGEASLRLGGTAHTGTMRGESNWTDISIVGIDLASNEPYTAGLQTSSNSFTTDYYMRDVIYGLDTKLKWKGLLLQGEWNHRTVQNILDGDKESDFNAYYALLGYEITLSPQYTMTPYAMHERIAWENGANNPALDIATFPMKGWSIYMLGLNFGLWNNVHLKAEWSHNEIDANAVGDRSEGTYNNYSSDDLTVERYAAQLSVSF